MSSAIRIVTCKEIWIRFKATHLQGQRIRYSEVLAAVTLSVTFEAEYITLSFISATNGVLKMVVFNRDEIVEVEATEVTEVAS